MTTESEVIEATFGFIDVAGFTALTEAHGDEAAAQLIRRFQKLVAACIAPDDRLLDAVGDAVLVMHPGPDQAVQFVARVFALTAVEPEFPALRAGLHHGTAVSFGGRLIGASINLAARVTAQAHAGQVVATAMVSEAARAAGIEVASLGWFTLRNVRDPVELFALHCGLRHDHEVLDPVCRMRVRTDRAAGRLQHLGSDYWFCSLECAGKFAEAPATYLR